MTTGCPSSVLGWPADNGAQLVALGNDISAKSNESEKLQAEVQVAQQAIEQDVASYQKELANLQSTMLETDTTLRQQLEGTLAQVQLAYDEIAARQSAAASQASPQNNDHSEDHDDGEHEEHSENEHDDD